jgi:hypothetical protein
VQGSRYKAQGKNNKTKLILFLRESAGAMQNIKFQAPNLRVLGVGCQVSGKRNIEVEH